MGCQKEREDQLTRGRKSGQMDHSPIYNMYRDRPECRYAIYIICIVRDSGRRRPTIPLRPQPYTITDKIWAKIRKILTAKQYISFGVAKQTVSQAQTDRFASQNRPFRNAKWPLLQTIECQWVTELDKSGIKYELYLHSEQADRRIIHGDNSASLHLCSTPETSKRRF